MKGLVCRLLLGSTVTALGGCGNARLMELSKETDSLSVKEIQLVNGHSVTIRSGKALEIVRSHRNELDGAVGISISGFALRKLDLAEFSELHVTRLTLVSCGAGDETAAEIGDLKTLAALRIHDCPVTDAGIEKLSGLKNLVELDVTDCQQVTGEGFAKWPPHESLRSLSLYGSAINDAGAKALRCLPNLRRCDLGNTKVSVDGCLELAVLPHLVGPGFPDDVTPDWPSRTALLQRYNDRYAELHGERKQPPFTIPR